MGCCLWFSLKTVCWQNPEPYNNTLGRFPPPRASFFPWQNPDSKVSSVRESLRKIYRNGGVGGLWHGTSAGVMKTVPKYCVAVTVKVCGVCQRGWDGMGGLLLAPGENSMPAVESNVYCCVDAHVCMVLLVLYIHIYIYLVRCRLFHGERPSVRRVVYTPGAFLALPANTAATIKNKIK